MNKLKLAMLVSHLENMPKSAWGFNTWGTATPACGTIGCLAGHCLMSEAYINDPTTPPVSFTISSCLSSLALDNYIPVSTRAAQYLEMSPDERAMFYLPYWNDLDINPNNLDDVIAHLKTLLNDNTAPPSNVSQTDSVSQPIQENVEL